MVIFHSYVKLPEGKGWFKQNPSNLSVRAEEKEYPFIDCQQIPDFVILVSFFVGDISLLAELDVTRHVSARSHHKQLSYVSPQRYGRGFLDTGPLMGRISVKYSMRWMNHERVTSLQCWLLTSIIAV